MSAPPLAGLPGGPGPIVALRSDAGDRLEIRGADRARFLNGLVTAAVKDLGEGDGTFGFFTARKGGVLADFALLALADRFWLELPPGRGAAIRAHLEIYRLADRVDLVEPEMAPLAVIGVEAEAALTTLFGAGAVPSAPWSHRSVELAGRTLRVQNRPNLGAPAWQLWAPLAELEAVAAEVQAATGGRLPAAEELELLRVLAGHPHWGIDYGEDSLPQETGLEAAIHYTKGCYLGQEIVARIHYRGGVQRGLVGLRLAGPAVAGAELSFENRPVGTLGTVLAVSPLGSIALAIVHRRGGELGTRLTLPGETTAEVVALPFSPQEGI